MHMKEPWLVINPPIENDELNSLFRSDHPDHRTRDYKTLLAHSLLYVLAYDGSELVGFISVAWDGGVHGFKHTEAGLIRIDPNQIT